MLPDAARMLLHVQLLDPPLLGRQLLRWKLRRSVFKGFFALFPGEKSVKVSAAVECATGRALQPVNLACLWR